ncbi:MAG: hypothetical protein NTV11_16695 [Rhodocyclales bacterium]|nr:hypothetical protein [Rhodocyclales bacterium]
MFADPDILGGLYDALKENNLLDPSSAANSTAALVGIWSVMLKQGISRLETEDQMLLLGMRLAFFRSISTGQCGRILKGEPADGVQFYAWLAARPDKVIDDFLRISADAVKREVTGAAPREIMTEEQGYASAALLGRKVARTYSNDKVKLVTQAVDGDRSLTDNDYCVATRIIWREALNMKGDARRWIVRGIFN